MQQIKINGITILYVEDDENIRNLIARMFSMRHPELKFLVAENGEKGLELFRDYCPDIIIADINMPVMNGIQMAKRIKALNPEAIIIAVTAHNDPAYLLEAIETGMSHYIMKPVDIGNFFKIIDKSIENITLKRLVREQEKQIRINERQLSEAQKITHLGSWEWDIVSGEITWSEEFYRILGLDPVKTAASYESFLERVHPEDRKAVNKVMQKSLDKRQAFAAHYCRIIRPDGSIRVIHCQGEVLVDALGQPMFMIGVSHDVTERALMEEALRHQAHHDALTDLPNRQLFMDFMTLELSQARRNGKKLALLFLDLNGFKQVNDSLGHGCGDRLLQEVAQRLKRCIRESDTVARIGGDEFTVLMPDLIQIDDVGIVLRKILRVFEKPFMLDEIAVNTSTSIGISMFPDDGGSSEELIKKADLAMYDAKTSSRNNAYQFYNSEINARTIKRHEMENMLRQAVRNKEMEILFQPVASAGTRAIVGVEALLRWRHPVHGLLAPDQFIAIAEDTGAIVPIGEWVISSVCAQARQWNEEGHALCATVNLSDRQFHHPALIEKTAEILENTGLKPGMLGFEITENTIMNNMELSLRSMQTLAKMGVNLAIDNFGSGSSSLHSIKNMPAHKIKIDKSFIKNMLTESCDMAILNSITAISHNLHMKVVANGVETEEQCSAIRDMGCDEVQGYVISGPLPADEFERLVARI